MTRNMMMTQSYYSGGDYDAFSRSTHRSMSAATGYYDRSQPYGYHEPLRQELRSEYGSGGGRPITRAMIHEPDSADGGSGSSRRRIAVACSRCRRRKIKCSGDPGDGSGCQACRASGADVNACTFIRVGSHQALLVPNGVEAYPQASSAGSLPPTVSYGSDAPPSSGWHGNHHLHSRPSLPTLHTRSSWMDNYDTYENSPIDQYSYSATVPRQDSFASTYGQLENYRSWSTTGGISAPVSAPAYYEQPQAYSFGSLQAPHFPPMAVTRLPSVTADSFAMGPLQTSLPMHTAQERRLPAPYTVTYGPQTSVGAAQSQAPEVRPLSSLSEPRGSVNRSSSRAGLPDVLYSTSASGRAPSINHLAPPTALPSLQPLQYNNTVAGAESGVGYQYNLNNSLALPSTDPGDVSPTTGPPLSEGYQSTASSGSGTASMAPPNFRYASTTYQHLPALNLEEQPRPMTSASQTAVPANLYSFSSDTAGDRPTTSDSDQGSSGTISSGSAASYGQTIRQPQPQHAGHVEAVRRQTSFEQQRAATAQRMSVSTINGQY